MDEAIERSRQNYQTSKTVCQKAEHACQIAKGLSLQAKKVRHYAREIRRNKKDRLETSPTRVRKRLKSRNLDIYEFVSHLTETQKYEAHQNGKSKPAISPHPVNEIFGGSIPGILEFTANLAEAQKNGLLFFWPSSLKCCWITIWSKTLCSRPQWDGRCC